MSRICACLLAVCLSLLLGGCASVMRAPCESPRISNRWAPAAYVVKLPLESGDPAQAAPGRRELETLMDARVIAMAHAVGSTHLTLLDESPGHECDIGDVYDAVTTNGQGFLWRSLFHSAVFIWGDVYGGEEGSLFVKLYMRVYWNGSDGAARVVYPGGRGESDLVFTSRFPDSTISFPRRRLDAATLKRMREQLTHLQARIRPDVNAPPAALTRQFVIAAADDQWLKLSSLDGREAWVPQANVAELSTALLPELEFAQGVVAYLNFKVTRSAEAARGSLAALDAFKRAPIPEGARASQLELPLAIADVIASALGRAREKEQEVFDSYRNAQGGAPALGTGKTLMDELRDVQNPSYVTPAIGYANAQALVPADSDILTLSALGQIPYCCSSGDAEERSRRIKRITQALEGARAIDAANIATVQNLLSWYLLLLRLDADLLPHPPAELARRVASLQRIVEPR